MSRWLYEFWKDVADPSWPAVEYWSEFAKTDTVVQQECWTDHGLARHLYQSENFEHYHCRSLFSMYRKDDWVFVNVPGNGYIHFQDFFVNRLQWQRFRPNCYQDLEDVILFGIMMDPYRRYLKGLATFFWDLYGANALSTVDMPSLFDKIQFPDIHSMPMSHTLRQIINQVIWIPFELMSPESVKQCMNALFQKKSSTVAVPFSHPLLNQSPTEKLEIYQQIKTTFFTHDISRSKQALHVHRTLIPEAIFYRNLVAKFSPDWQHLN